MMKRKDEKNEKKERQEGKEEMKENKDIGRGGNEICDVKSSSIIELN